MISADLMLRPSLLLKVGPFESTISASCTDDIFLAGVVESLWRETEPLGIRTLLIEPGRFRTLLLSNNNRKTQKSAISDYNNLSTGKSAGLDAEDRKQPGDPIKLAEIVLDLVRKEGIAEGKEVPLRMPLGIDVYDDVKAKCEETLKLLEEWKGVIRSTDYEGA
jgi:hypothetical protein